MSQKKILIASTNQGKILEFKNFFNNNYNVISLTDLECYELHKPKDIDEKYNLFCQNSFLKMYETCVYLAKYQKNLTATNIDFIVVDDSGLSVPRLKFQPGVNSAYFAGKPRSDDKNRQKLKQAVLQETGTTKSKIEAFFVSVLCVLNQIQFAKMLEIKNIDNFFQQHESFFSGLELMFMNDINISLFEKNFSIYSNLFQQQEIFIDIAVGACKGFVGTVENSSGFGHGYDSMFYLNKQEDKTFATISNEAKNLLSHRGAAARAIKF
jgi:inosine/xanthosine triphosphate pyrophosphatase family protein